jgi:hypothetical protein
VNLLKRLRDGLLRTVDDIPVAEAFTPSENPMLGVITDAVDMDQLLRQLMEGGPGSGHWHHVGILGHKGGSAKSGVAAPEGGIQAATAPILAPAAPAGTAEATPPSPAVPAPKTAPTVAPLVPPVPPPPDDGEVNLGIKGVFTTKNHVLIGNEWVHWTNTELTDGEWQKAKVEPVKVDDHPLPIPPEVMGDVAAAEAASAAESAATKKAIEADILAHLPAGTPPPPEGDLYYEYGTKNVFTKNYMLIGNVWASLGKSPGEFKAVYSLAKKEYVLEPWPEGGKTPVAPPEAPKEPTPKPGFVPLSSAPLGLHVSGLPEGEVLTAKPGMSQVIAPWPGSTGPAPYTIILTQHATKNYVNIDGAWKNKQFLTWDEDANEWKVDEAKVRAEGKVPFKPPKRVKGELAPANYETRDPTEAAHYREGQEKANQFDDGRSWGKFGKGYENHTAENVKSANMRDIAQAMLDSPAAMKAVNDLRTKDPGTWNYLARMSDHAKEYVDSHPGLTPVHIGLISIVDKAMLSWASTSDNGQKASVMMQVAVNQEFGIGHIRARKRNAPEDMYDDAKKDPALPIYRQVARSMYNHTQKQLDEAGIDRLPLMRGMDMSEEDKDNIPAGFKRTGVRVQSVKLMPLSSFSRNQHDALSFAGHVKGKRAVVSAWVPRERIFSTATTGLGCLGEDELVVLAGRGKARVKVW